MWNNETLKLTAFLFLQALVVALLEPFWSGLVVFEGHIKTWWKSAAHLCIRPSRVQWNTAQCRKSDRGVCLRIWGIRKSQWFIKVIPIEPPLYHFFGCSHLDHLDSLQTYSYVSNCLYHRFCSWLKKNRNTESPFFGDKSWEWDALKPPFSSVFLYTCCCLLLIVEGV